MIPISPRCAAVALDVRFRSGARFPFPIETVNGSSALATFERLKRAGQGSPVILGSGNALDMIVHGLAERRRETVESVCWRRL